eukprot:9346911-Pyramimonas_sp.AAC.1
MTAPNISCMPTSMSAGSSWPTRSTCITPPWPSRPRGIRMPERTGMCPPTPVAKALLLFTRST